MYDYDNGMGLGVWGDSGKGKRFEKRDAVGIIYLYRGLKEAPRAQGIQLIKIHIVCLGSLSPICFTSDFL